MTSSSILYTSHPSLLTNSMSSTSTSATSTNCNINNSNNNISSSLNSSNGINNPLNSSNGFDISNIDQSLKHCGCRNPKELIQLIRSDAIENIELSWPDDMGLWYVNVIKSHEVSLQNLVEGIKVTGQTLLVDPTSARFDLSKKQKTILIRCSNVNRYSSSSNSSDDDYEEEEEVDGEVVKSPQSKFSLLLEESEKLRKSFKSSAPAFFKPKNSTSSPSSPPTKPLKYHHSSAGAAGGSSAGDRYSGKRSSSSNYTSNQQQQPQHQQQNDQDIDASWIEDMKKNNRIELVPDLSSPFYSSGGIDKRSPSPILGGSSCLSSSSGSSSPGLPIETTDSPPGGSSIASSSNSTTPDLTTVDSAERAILEGQIHLPPLLRPRQYHACKIPKEDRPSKRRKNHTSLFCRHCGTTDTPEWRRGPDGRKSLCNACGLHYSKLVKRENMAVPQLSRTFDIAELLNPTD